MDARTTTDLLKRPGSLTGVAVVVVALLLGGYRLTHSTSTAETVVGSPDASHRLAVAVAAVQIEAGFDREVNFVGRIEAARESELSFERAGLVTQLLVDEGDDVAAEQIIGHLDTTKLMAQRTVMAARLDAAQALLQELVAGPRAEDVKAQRAEVQRLGHELKRIELSRDRNEELLKRAATSRDQYEADLYAAQATKAALDAARAELEALENGTRSERVEAQRAVVKELEAEIASIDVDLDKSKLLAPFAGSIGDRLVDEGNVVATGQTIVSLLEVARPELRVGVDSKTAAALNIGLSIPVVANSAEVSGTIKAIRSDVAGQTRTVDILISLPSPEKRFRSGELATAKIVQSVPGSGCWLPIAALTEGTRGLWSVFVAKPMDQDYVIERRDVEVLHTQTQRVFVRGAIADGERVVVSGIHRLVPNLRVTVQEAPLAWE